MSFPSRLYRCIIILTPLSKSVTVVSFLRLASVRHYASTSNPTWDQWDIVWWSTIEVEVGLICTCLPAMRLILVRLAPQVFGAEPGNST